MSIMTDSPLPSSQKIMGAGDQRAERDERVRSNDELNFSSENDEAASDQDADSLDFDPELEEYLDLDFRSKTKVLSKMLENCSSSQVHAMISMATCNRRSGASALDDIVAPPSVDWNAIRKKVKQVRGIQGLKILVESLKYVGPNATGLASQLTTLTCDLIKEARLDVDQDLANTEFKIFVCTAAHHPAFSDVERQSLLDVLNSESESNEITKVSRFITAVVPLTVQRDARRADAKKKHYVFLLNVCWSTGEYETIQRSHNEFFDFQCKLLDMFPIESQHGTRTIPYLPGKKILSSGFKNAKAVAESRLPAIMQYLRNLFKLPPKISHCSHVLGFFRASSASIPAAIAIHSTTTTNTTTNTEPTMATPRVTFSTPPLTSEATKTSPSSRATVGKRPLKGDTTQQQQQQQQHQQQQQQQHQQQPPPLETGPTSTLTPTGTSILTTPPTATPNSNAATTMPLSDANQAEETETVHMSTSEANSVAPVQYVYQMVGPMMNYVVPTAWEPQYYGVPQHHHHQQQQQQQYGAQQMYPMQPMYYPAVQPNTMQYNNNNRDHRGPSSGGGHQRKQKHRSISTNDVRAPKHRERTRSHSTSTKLSGSQSLPNLLKDPPSSDITALNNGSPLSSTKGQGSTGNLSQSSRNQSGSRTSLLSVTEDGTGTEEVVQHRKKVSTCVLCGKQDRETWSCDSCESEMTPENLREILEDYNCPKPDDDALLALYIRQVTWLKACRMHKYARALVGKSREWMQSVTEEEFTKLGLTSGAQKKLTLKLADTVEPMPW